MNSIRHKQISTELTGKFTIDLNKADKLISIKKSQLHIQLNRTYEGI